MRKEYDFSKSKKNPYLKKLKQITKRQITIRIDASTIEYFKKMAQETGMPYQSLMNLYLQDCAKEGKKLLLKWN